MNDARGLPLGIASAAARDAAETARWRMTAFYDVPLPDLDLAIEADPGWMLPHLMKAGFLLSLTEPAGAESQTASRKPESALRLESPSQPWVGPGWADGA